MLYRLLIGGQPPNPNGPQFQLIGDPNSRRGQVYEVLRENVDYIVDPSQLWVKLTQPLNLNNERLVVAYTVRAGGAETTNANTGGTPDLTYVASRPQYANLLWDPQVQPGDAASFRQLRNVYRIGGSDVQRNSVGVTIVTGTTFDQEKPAAGSSSTFLQLFGVAQPGNPGSFDTDNRLWPRPGDPGYTLAANPALGLPGASGAAAGAPTGATDQFLVFPSLLPFARAGLAQPAANPANDAIYSTPDIYLYSSQHPQPVFRIHLRYQSDGSGDGSGITLGSTQIRPLSERLTLDDGTLLKRDADYIMDYDFGPRDVPASRHAVRAAAKRHRALRRKSALRDGADVDFRNRLDAAAEIRRHQLHRARAVADHHVHAAAARLRGAVVADRRSERKFHVQLRPDRAFRRRASRRKSARARSRAYAIRGRHEPAAVCGIVAGISREFRRQRRHHRATRRPAVVSLEPAGARKQTQRADRRLHFRST